MGSDAQDFVVNIIPLVLRTSIEIVSIHDHTQGNEEIQKQHYAARTEDFFFELPDSLNLHDRVLYLF